MPLKKIKKSAATGLRAVRNGLAMILSPQIKLGQILHGMKYVINTTIFNKKIVRTVEIMHTLRCNCACAFCSNEKLSENHRLMKKEDVIYALDKLISHGTVGFFFLGGETMTDPNLITYIEHVRKKNAIPMICTNGTLLTEDNIKNLAKAGLFLATITIHDTIPEKHNSIVRRENSLETVMKAIPILKKYHIQVFLKTIYSKESVSSGAFERILQLAKDYDVKLNVNPIMPVGRGFNDRYILNEREKKEYMRCTLCDDAITTHTKGNYDSQCPAGWLYLGILPDGEILPCYFLPVSVGNIRNTDISTAQKRSAELNIFKKGADSCIMAMNRKFYEKIIKELYSGKYKLPVRVYENPSLQKKFHDFAEQYKI